MLAPLVDDVDDMLRVEAASGTGGGRGRARGWDTDLGIAAGRDDELIAWSAVTDPVVAADARELRRASKAGREMPKVVVEGEAVAEAGTTGTATAASRAARVCCS